MAGWGLGYGGVRNPDPEERFDGTPFSNFDLPDGISVLTLKIIDTYGMRMNKLLTTITLLCFSAVSFGETYICTSDNGDHTYVWTRTETGFSERLRDNEENRDIGELESFSIINEQGSLLTLVQADYWPVGEYTSDSDNIWVTLAIINKETGDSVVGLTDFLMLFREFSEFSDGPTTLFTRHSCVTVQ